MKCADVALNVFYYPVLTKPVIGVHVLGGKRGFSEGRFLLLLYVLIKSFLGTTKFGEHCPPIPILRGYRPGCNALPGIFGSYELLCLKRPLIIYLHYSDTLQPTATSKEIACRYYCDRNARTASAQCFTLWQPATIEIMRRNHSIIVCSRLMYMVVVLREHPFRGESHIQRNAKGEVVTIRTGTPEDGGMAGEMPSALSKERNGGGGAFITVSLVISWFIKIDLKQIYYSYSGTQKIQNDFP